MGHTIRRGSLPQRRELSFLAWIEGPPAALRHVVKAALHLVAEGMITEGLFFRRLSSRITDLRFSLVDILQNLQMFVLVQAALCVDATALNLVCVYASISACSD